MIYRWDKASPTNSKKFGCVVLCLFVRVVCCEQHGQTCMHGSVCVCVDCIPSVMMETSAFLALRPLQPLLNWLKVSVKPSWVMMALAMLVVEHVEDSVQMQASDGTRVGTMCLV